MSSHYESEWRIQKEKRRKAYLDRIQENSQKFFDRYSAKFIELVNQGLEQYMPSDFKDLRAQLNRLERLVSSDPESARDLSFDIGDQLSRLPGLARVARNEFEAGERQRQIELAEMRRKATSELAQFIHEMISQIKDPVELDFAFEQIRSIQSEFHGRTTEAEELPKIKAEIQSQFAEVRRAAQEKAVTWKKEKIRETAKEATETLFDMYKEQATSDTRKNPEEIKELLENLESLKQQANTATPPEDIRNKIVELSNTADKAVVDESCRRLVVTSIMDSLEKSGFVVSKPRRSVGEKDEVVILARKPAGAEATFRVTSNGSMIYKFDHYEGMQCKEDLDKVLPLLKDIYGIDLSNERILWKNPERISKSAKPIEDDSKGHSSG